MNADQPLSRQPEPVLLEWRVHLARRPPLRAAVSLAMVIAAACSAWVVMGSPLFAVTVALLLLAAIADGLFPIRYRMTPQGVSARGVWSLRRMRWPQVRRCYRDAHGIKLSPLSRHSRLEAYRGLYLWLEGNEGAVLAVIGRCRAGADRSAQGRA